MSMQRVQGMLLFLVHFNNSVRFEIHGVTRSSSSRPFLCALGFAIWYDLRTDLGGYKIPKFSGGGCPQTLLKASALCAEVRTNVVCTCCALATAMSWLCHCSLQPFNLSSSDVILHKNCDCRKYFSRKECKASIIPSKSLYVNIISLIGSFH